MHEESESVVQIDEYRLDRECVKLPSDYLKWAHKAAEAKRDVDEAKAALDVIEAELSRNIRSKPEVYGLEKVTEAGVNAAVLLEPTYRKALKALQDLRHQYDMDQAVVWALETKKRTLTLLVDLHGMGYYSEIKVSEKGRDAVKKMTERRLARSRED